MTRQNATQTQQQTSTTNPLSSGGILQRKCASCGQQTIAGGECNECQKKRLPLHRRATNQTEPDEVPSIVYEVLNSPGHPLDLDTRTFMGSHFRHDFSQVRVHTDTKAAESARAINALAYAAGSHIVFSKGAFQPSTRPGQQVLAHELSHVVQEDHIKSNKLLLGDPETAEEVSAERAAASITDRSQKAAHTETYESPISMSPVGRRSLPNPSVGMVRRIYVPPKPKLSRAELRRRERFNDLDDTMRRWRHTYTQQTQNVTDQLKAAMFSREDYVESLQLDSDAEKRIQSITDRFFSELKQELARKPQDDPNQEGNVLGIWRKWDAAFSNQLAIEQLRKDATDTEVPEEPGDYPQPENPLDLPQDKGEEEPIA